MIKRPWAFWRRAQYGGAFSIILLLCGYWFYSAYIYAAPTCFDGSQNGMERGVDCGGGCQLVCDFDVTKPAVKWARSFKVTDGQYNAVAYVENLNKTVGTTKLTYTFSLYDDEGLITSRTSVSAFPPNGVYPIFEGRINTDGRVPTKTFIDFEDVPAWTALDFGREAYTVLSRELLDVNEKPKLNATIRNTNLTTGGQTEVVATIFDARGNALTTSRTFVDNFKPNSQEQVVFTWPEPIAKTLRSCEVPTDVVVAIDLSGSMNNDSDNPPEPITSVIAAAGDFVARLNTQDQAALVTFATDALIKLGFTNSATVEASIDKLTIEPAEETGSTNTGDAFVRAGEIFNSAKQNSNARKVLVILTDGLATAPDEEPELYALGRAQELKDDDVEVYAIGLGEKVNMDFVRSIASENKSYQALSRGQVDSIYKEITGAICEDGPAIIDIVSKPVF